MTFRGNLPHVQIKLAEVLSREHLQQTQDMLASDVMIVLAFVVEELFGTAARRPQA